MLQERLSYALPGPSRIIDSLLIYLLTYLQEPSCCKEAEQRSVLYLCQMTLYC